MLLSTLENRIRNPKVFEAGFGKFWKAIGAKLVQEKTVAQLTRYDSQQMADGTTNFFKSGPVAFQTNMNSFTPPESEHFLITRVRIFEGVSVNVVTTDWDAGPTSQPAKSAEISMVNNGVRVLAQIPLTDFLDTLTTKDLGTLDLEEPIAWIGQTDMVTTIVTDVIPVLNTNLRVELIGIGYIS